MTISLRGANWQNWLWVFVVCLLLWPGDSPAETLNQVINPKTARNQWVSDMVGVVDAATKQRLNALIDELEQKTSAEIAVVTIHRTDGRDPKEFATELFKRWGIGKKDKDNGILVLLVMEARRVEVETGYGVEGVLPDGKVGAILDKEVIPRFKQGDFGGGLLSGVQAMAKTLDPSLKASLPARLRAPATSIPSGTPGTVTPYSTWLFVLAALLALIGCAIGYTVWRSGIRYCPQCRKRMRRLTEDQDEAYLSFAQQLEEELGSVDYRVWRCDDCQLSKIERITRLSSRYENCPKCGHSTVDVKSYTLREPSYEREGLEEITKVCLISTCGFRRTLRYPIPRLRWSSGGVWPSGGGFQGRGWPSGGGWSSGGSFGGGGSGGGGAGRRW